MNRRSFQCMTVTQFLDRVIKLCAVFLQLLRLRLFVTTKASSFNVNQTDPCIFPSCLVTMPLLSEAWAPHVFLSPHEFLIWATAFSSRKKPCCRDLGQHDIVLAFHSRPHVTRIYVVFRCLLCLSTTFCLGCHSARRRHQSRQDRHERELVGLGPKVNGQKTKSCVERNAKQSAMRCDTQTWKWWMSC